MDGSDMMKRLDVTYDRMVDVVTSCQLMHMKRRASRCVGRLSYYSYSQEKTFTPSLPATLMQMPSTMTYAHPSNS